ncbi:MAG: hypothetical protein NTU73_03065, partial [Ignavibacteriae bacterium]|nr:hypothetical protein [Ignavibacteriota bacterium]
MKKYLIIALFFTFFLPAYSQNTDEGNIKELTILHWNDFHARNMPYKINKKDSLGNQYQVFVGGTSGMLGYL